MNKTRKHNLLSFFLCAVLIAAMALSMMGCNEQPNNGGTTTTTTTTTAAKVSFTLTVTDKDGNSENFTITTDKATVGDALLAEGLIAGEEGAYGLYIKTVNGITADYDVDGTYWAFYINGEYASTGVDTTPVTADAAYTLKVEK